MKKIIADLLRKWANKLNPHIIICQEDNPRECFYIPIQSEYEIVPVRCAYLFPHKFGETVNPDNITQIQMDWAYQHIAEEFAKALIQENKIKFDIRTAYNNEVMLEGELYVGIKQTRP